MVNEFLQFCSANHPTIALYSSLATPRDMYHLWPDIWLVIMKVSSVLWGLRVLMVNMKITFFWDVTVYSVVYRCQHFGENCYPCSGVALFYIEDGSNRFPQNVISTSVPNYMQSHSRKLYSSSAFLWIIFSKNLIRSRIQTHVFLFNLIPIYVWNLKPQ